MHQEHLTLKYTCDNHTVEFTVEGSSDLYEMLQTFENFLRAVGYHVNGSLTILGDDA